jgi:uncharacterized repeat protein (TIGR01451 family)
MNNRTHVMETFRRLSLVPLIGLGFLSIVATGGGGGSNPPPPPPPPDGVITTTNATRLIGNVIDTGDASGGVAAASLSSSGGSGRARQSSSQSGLAHRLNTYLKNTLTQAGRQDVGGHLTAAATPINETEPCPDGGSIHYSGTINNDGTGTLTATYSNCRTGQETTNGQITLRVDAFNLTFFIPTDSTFTISSLTITSPGIDQTFTGTLRDQMNIAINTETLTFNVNTNDNMSGESVRAENLVVVDVYNNILSPSSYTETITGRVNDSVHGSVDVVTVVALTFSSLSQLLPDSGQLILTGAANAHIRVTALSAVLVKVELDLDGDSVYELAATLKWTELGGPVGADLGDDDGDGIHNSWENVNGLDPLDPADAFVDSDGDGFVNVDEYLAGTNPRDVVSTTADVAISKTGPSDTLVGESLAYTITVVNWGPSLARDVEVTDVLPSTLGLVSVTPSQGFCVGSSTVTCDLGDLAAGSSVTINLSVTVPTEGTYSNTATVTNQTPDGNLANNSATATTTVATTATADVSISKTGAAGAMLGESFAYAITIANAGPALALGVKVTDVLPAGLSLVSVTSSQGVCGGSSTITCDLGGLAAGSNVTINLSVTASTEGTYINTASATSQTPDGNLANNAATVTTTVVTAGAGIDQQQPLIDSTVGGSGIGGASEQLLAQVVTSGVSGTLTQVRLPVTCDTGSDLIVEIQEVAGSVPNGVVLTSQTIPGTNLPSFFPAPPSFRSLVFSAPVFFSAGTPFAIVLRSAGACGVFQGPIGDPYPGGDGFFDARPNAPDVWVPLGTRSDLPFQTLVDPNG